MLGDAGEAMDAAARTAYRRRIEALRAEADDALEAGQLETAEAAHDELDVLVPSWRGLRARRQGAAEASAAEGPAST